MLINTTLSPETAARDLPNSRAADSSPAPSSAALPASRTDASAWRLPGPDALEADGLPAIPGAAGADEVMESFRANLLSQAGTALSAQANLNPDSVYNLLQ
jgi:hypothetical protein